MADTFADRILAALKADVEGRRDEINATPEPNAIRLEVRRTTEGVRVRSKVCYSAAARKLRDSPEVG